MNPALEALIIGLSIVYVFGPALIVIVPSIRLYRRLTRKGKSNRP